MNDTEEILWRLCQEHYTHGRHHETLRATTTNILLVIAGGIVAIIAHDQQPTLRQLPLTLFMVVLGLVGALFTAKYHERFDMNMQRARGYRDALETLLPATNIKKIKTAADAISEKKHRFLFGLRLYRFWIALHLLVAALGLLLTLQIVWSVS